MKRAELEKETCRILNILAEEKSFRAVKERLPGLTDREIWQVISIAASRLKRLPVERRYGSLWVYIDGAAEPNPGPSGIGIVIYDEKRKKIKEVRKYIGLATNNVAEYKALVQGLQESKKLSAQNVSILSDSQLLINQMNGRFRINNKHLLRLFQQAKNLESKFDKVIYRAISRNNNKLADQLANLAIKKA